MKKNLFLFTIAALAMTGCSQDEVTNEVVHNNAIEFGTYTGRPAQTRAATTTESIKNGFGVLAYYTGKDNWKSDGSFTPNFMYNQKVTGTNVAEGGNTTTKWTYEPVKYWPTTQNDKISFFAYAPYNDAGNDKGIELSGNSVANTPTLKFTVADAVENMVDFVADVQIDMTHKDKDDSKSAVENSEVKFKFLHELTRVGFVAVVDEDVKITSTNSSTVESATRVVVRDIKIKTSGVTDNKFYKSATYTFANEDDAPTIKRGTWSDMSGTWTASGGTMTDFDLLNIMNTEGFPNDFLATGTTAPTDDKGGVWLKLTDDNPTNLLKSDKYLFLIPVNGETGTGDSDNITAVITYDIITADSNLSKGYSITSATKEVNLALGEGWLKQGYAYTYIFKIGIDEIKVSADVDTDWSTDSSHTNHDVEVDYTDTDITSGGASGSPANAK